MWLLYGYLQQGRRSDARRVLAGCRVVATSESGLELRAPEHDPLDPDNIPAGSYIQMWSRYLIDTGDFDDPMARDDFPLGSLSGARFTRAFVRALAAAAAHDSSRLGEAAAEASDARRGLEAAAGRREDADRYLRRADVLEQEIEALVRRDRGQLQDGIDLLKQAATREAAMPVEFGPPFVDKPASELLGDLLLAADRPGDAAAAYEAALTRSPRRTASLLGLARAAAQTGSPRAASAYAELRTIWHRAERMPADVAPR
jgi:hypothetical protein